MALKLGEALVKAGLITPMDLDEALNSQVIFGGKLGTNLLEMGCIKEEELVKFLSKVTGVPSVRAEQMRSLSPEIIALIPKQLAAKFQVIPLTLDKKRLVVAMADPGDYTAIEELSFATGLIINPMIAPELVIARYLEKYYQIKREIRSIGLKGGTGRQRLRTETRVKETREELPGNLSVPVEEPDVLDFSKEEFKGFHIEAEEAQPVAPAVRPKMKKTADALTPLTPDAVVSLLAEPEDRDSVANLIIRYAAQKHERAALFIIKGDKAVGWNAMERQKSLPDFGRLEIALDHSTVLRQVVQNKSFYLGPVPETPGNQKMLSGFGKSSKPSQALLIPLLMLKRVIAVLYVDGSVGTKGEDIMDLQKLVNKGTMSLEILILKNKILMT